MTDPVSPTGPAPFERFARILFFAAIIAGAWLRFSGLNWGLPERVDFHPDERSYVIKYALKIGPGAWDPGFLNYPNFIHHSIALVLGLLRQLGVETSEVLACQVGRALSSLYGTLTIVLAWVIAGQLGARRWGQALAALWVALLPLHVWESHVAVTDVMMTFWIMAMLVGALRVADSTRPAKVYHLVYCGITLGLAVGSKYTAAISGVALLMALLYSRRHWRTLLWQAMVVGACALLACFIVTPHSFLRFNDLLEAMAFEHEHVHGHHQGFSTTAPGWQYHKFVYQIVAAWPFSLGLALYVSVGIGVLWSTYRCSRARSIPLAVATILFLIMGSWTYTPIRYYLPIIVIGAVFAGVWHGALLSGSRRARYVGLLVVAVTFAYTAGFSFSTNARYLDDTRVQAARWMDRYSGAPLRVAVIGAGAYSGFTRGNDDLQLNVYPESHAAHVQARRPFDVLEISSLHYLRWLRHDRPVRYRDMYGRVRDGDTDLVLVKRFEANFPQKWLYSWLDPMYECFFVSPTLEFYAPLDIKQQMELGLRDEAL